MQTAPNYFKVRRLPIKYNLTRFDVLADKIHKLSLHDNKERIFGMQEKGSVADAETIRKIAIIVSSMTSSHSWQTYKSISKQSDELNSANVKEEYNEAVKERWKQVTPSDINELANLNISDSVFHRWLFFNVPWTEHNAYKRAWLSLKKEMEMPKDYTEKT
jgi:hypothetical protein